MSEDTKRLQTNAKLEGTVKETSEQASDTRNDLTAPRKYQQLLDMSARQFINYIYHYC